MYKEANVYIMAMGAFYIQCSLLSSIKGRLACMATAVCNAFPGPLLVGDVVSTEWLVSNMDRFANKEVTSVLGSALQKTESREGNLQVGGLANRISETRV